MYKIIIKKKAKKFIDKLPKNEKMRIVKAIEVLPNGEDIKKLKGHTDLFRLRVGDYRIIYTVDNEYLFEKEEGSCRCTLLGSLQRVYGDSFDDCRYHLCHCFFCKQRIL